MLIHNEHGTRALIYTRVSDEKQVKEGSLSTQEYQVREHCDTYGIEVAHHIRAEGESGWQGDFIHFQEARAFMSAGGADVWIVRDLDRGARNLIMTLELLEQSKEEGWGLVALNIKPKILDPDDIGDWIMVVVMGMQAELYSRNQSAKVKAGMKREAANGTKFGNPKRISDETTDQIVKWSRRGKTTSEICRKLNMTGTPTARGASEWTWQTVDGVLKRHARDNPTRQRRGA
jgi:DNA invertase Pin-like site-specific DNA recombinase